MKKKESPLQREEVPAHYALRSRAELERLRIENAELKRKLREAEYMQRVTDEMSCSLRNIAKAAQ